MKIVILIISLFLSISSFGQKEKIIKIKTASRKVENDSVKSYSTTYATINIPFVPSDDLPLGQYRLFFKIDSNCQIKVKKDQIKDKRFSDNYLTALDVLLLNYKVEHYLDGKLQPNCEGLSSSILPVTISISE